MIALLRSIKLFFYLVWIGIRKTPAPEALALLAAPILVWTGPYMVGYLMGDDSLASNPVLAILHPVSSPLAPLIGSMLLVGPLLVFVNRGISNTQQTERSNRETHGEE